VVGWDRPPIANTRLDGGLPVNSGGVIKCVGVFNETYDAVTCP
jgi:hypothetical protein